MKHPTIELALTIFLVLLLMPLSYAAITSGRITSWDGETQTLEYSDAVSHYADGSLTNRNILVEICADSQADLLNKYTSLVYKVSTNYTTLEIIPPRIVSSWINSSNCTRVDVDLSRAKATYAGILSVVLSNSAELTSPTFYDLSQSTGFLDGNFTLEYTDLGATVNATVTAAESSNGTNITTDRNYIIIGIRNSTGDITDAGITSLNDPVTLQDPNTMYDFSVNRIILAGSITNGALSVTLNSPANNTYYNISNATFSCSALSNPDLQNITLYHNIGGSFQANITNDSISGFVDSASFPLTSIPDGTYLWNCLAVSASDDTFATTNRTVTIDTTNPSLNVSLSTTQVEYVTETITIDWNASDTNLDTKYINITYPDSSQLTYQTNDSNNITLNLNNLTQLGTYTITAYVNDSATNFNTTTVTFSVNDTTNPVTTLNSPENNIYNNTGNLSFTCSATDYGLSSITLYHNISGTFEPNQTLSASPNSSTITFNLTDLNDGIYAWNCLANDTSGLTDFANSNRTFTIDKTLPQVTLVLPYNGTYNSDGNMTFICNATDTNLDAIVFYHNISGTFQANQTSDVSPTAEQVEFNVTGLQDGEYVWNCLANDSAGNQNFAANRTFTEDPTNPNVALLSPDNNIYSNSENITLICQAININLDTIELYHNINGSFIQNQTLSLPEGTTSYIASFNLTNLPNDVTFQWNCFANDTQTLDRYNDTNRTVIIDQTDPVVALISPLNNSLLREQNITLICNATDLNLETISLYHNISGNWTLNQTRIVSAPFAEVNFTINNTADEVYKWNCLANDSATNDAFAPENFTFEIDAVLDLDLPEGVYEPLCCAGGGESCDATPFSTDDRNCDTGAVLPGTHLHTFSIMIYDINSTANDELECYIRQSNSSLIRLNTTLNAMANGQAYLNHTVSNMSNSVDSDTPWVIVNCTQYNTTDTILNNPINAILYVHNNTWTPVPGTDSYPEDDASKSFDCFNAQTGRYLNNSRECSFSGDVLYVVDQRTGALTESSCDNSQDDNSFLGIDCNDRTCSGLPFPWACSGFSTNHPYVAPYNDYTSYHGQSQPITGFAVNSITGNSIFDTIKDVLTPKPALITGYATADAEDLCTGNICSSILSNGIRVQYTQHTSPTGQFKVQYSGAITQNVYSKFAFKDIPYSFTNNQTSGSNQLTLQSHALVTNTSLTVSGYAPAGTTYETLSVNLSSAAASSYSSIISTQINGVPAQLSATTYVDSNAPTNDNESYNYTEITGQYPCADSVDNDLDEDTDCEDANCVGFIGDDGNAFLLNSGGLCEAAETTCFDLFDNDADGLADCLDPDCDGLVGNFTSSATCEYAIEGNDTNYPDNCNDLFDNDADNYLDCFDQDVCWQQGGTSSSNPCPAFENNSEAWCSDGLDNDVDNGLNSWDVNTSSGADCYDYDCAGNAACPATENAQGDDKCFDEIDNDLDAYGWNGTTYLEVGLLSLLGGTDCKDLDCNGVVNPANSNEVCRIQEFNLSLEIQVCGNSYDDDGDDNDTNPYYEGDGGTNCEDSDCNKKFGHCGPCPNVENYTWNACFDDEDNDVDSTNGVDNTDCTDTDCLNEIASNTGYKCAQTENTTALCSDNVDNDGDGNIDCLDSDCIAGNYGGCANENTTALCSDNLDNDNDNYIDCAESSCYGLAGCHTDLSGELTSCLSLPAYTIETFDSVGITVRYTSQILNNTNHIINVTGNEGTYANGELSLVFGVAAPGQPFPYDCSAMVVVATEGIETQCNVNNQIIIANNQSLGNFTAQITITPQQTANTTSYYLNGGAKGSTLPETTLSYRVWENTPPRVQDVEAVNETVSLNYGNALTFRAIPNDTVSGGISDSLVCKCNFLYNGTSSEQSDCTWEINFTQDGTYTIYANATDQPGNTGDYNQTNVTVNIVPISQSTSDPNRIFFNSSLYDTTLTAGYYTGEGDRFSGNCTFIVWNDTSVIYNTTTDKHEADNYAACSANINLTDKFFDQRNRTEERYNYNYTYDVTFVNGTNITVSTNVTMNDTYFPGEDYTYVLNNTVVTPYNVNVTYNHTLAHEDGMYFVQFNISDSDGDAVLSERRTIFVCNDLNSSGILTDGTRWTCEKADFDEDGWTEGLFTNLYYNISTTSLLACDSCLNQVNSGLDHDADGIDNVCDEICGNGIKENTNSEECDGNDFGELSCADYGHTSGRLTCSASCRVSPMLCYTPSDDDDDDSDDDDGPAYDVSDSPFDFDENETEEWILPLMEETPFAPVVACDRTIYTYKEESALDLSTYTIEGGSGDVVELGLELPEDHVVAIPPFKVSCEEATGKTIQIAIPDNLADVQAVICRDGLCGYKIVQATDTIGCETPEEHQEDIVDVKRFPINIEPIIGDLSFTDALRSNNLKIDFSETKENTTVSISEADVSNLANKDAQFVGKPIEIKSEGEDLGMVRVEVPYLPGEENETLVSLYAGTPDKQGTSWEYVGGTIDRDRGVIIADINYSEFVGQNDRLILGPIGVFCPNCFSSQLENIFTPKPDSKFAILFIHGLFSTPQTWLKVVDEIRLTNQPWQLWTYSYPTGRSVIDTADDLVKRLEAASERFDHIYIIGHSLGGMVAQRALYDAHNAGNSFVDKVRKVILIATPTEGTPLAVHLKDFISFFSNTDAEGALAVSPILNDELIHGLVTPRVPDIEYFVIAGTKELPITQGKLDGANDGLVPLRSAQRVGDGYYDQVCENFWSRDVSHNDLPKDELVKKVVEQIISKSAKEQLVASKVDAPVLGYTNYYEITIDDCNPEDEIVIFGKKMELSESDKALICSCGNGVCAGLESPFNCPQDCKVGALGAERIPIITLTLIVLAIVLILYLSLAYAPKGNRKRTRIKSILSSVKSEVKYASKEINKMFGKKTPKKPKSKR